MLRSKKILAGKCALMLAILTAVSAVSVGVYRVDSYAYAIYDKQARIRSVQEPQIIVVGGFQCGAGRECRTG